MLEPWTTWTTFTWRTRSELYSTIGDRDHKPCGFLVRRYDRPESSQRTVAPGPVDPISLPAARRAMSRFCYKIKPTAIWWATEPGERFGRHHIHALMRLTDQSLDRYPWALAFRWFGRSEIEDYDPEKGAAHYIGKYISKQIADHDYWRRRTGYR